MDQENRMVHESLGRVLVQANPIHAMASAILQSVRETGFILPVKESASGGKNGHWLTIKEDGEETHIFVVNGIVTKGPKHLIDANINHLPAHDGRTVTHHPAGHVPDGHNNHPSYHEGDGGVPHAREHGADQTRHKRHAKTEQETHHALQTSIKEKKVAREAAEKEATKRHNDKKAEVKKERVDALKKNDDKQAYDATALISIPVSKPVTKVFDKKGMKTTVTTVIVGHPEGKHFTVTGSTSSVSGEKNALSTKSKGWHVVTSDGSSGGSDEMTYKEAVNAAKKKIRGSK